MQARSGQFYHGSLIEKIDNHPIFVAISRMSKQKFAQQLSCYFDDFPWFTLIRPSIGHLYLISKNSINFFGDNGCQSWLFGQNNIVKMVIF